MAELPPVVVGIIGAAGVLTALVPGSMMLMAASTTLAKDVYPLVRGKAAEREVAVAAKVFVPCVASVALYFALAGGDTIVALLLMGYALVTQLFPALAVSLTERRPFTGWGAFAGICVGVGIVMATTITKATLVNILPGLPGWIQDLNIGVVALGLNIATALAVSAVERRIPARVGASVPAE